jgi:hypothetical protein
MSASSDTEVILKLLEENFAEVRGVRRLDQQLVYVDPEVTAKLNCRTKR